MTFADNDDKAITDPEDYLVRFAGRHFERVNDGGDRHDVVRAPLDALSDASTAAREARLAAVGQSTRAAIAHALAISDNDGSQ